jgi:eukaryotic-like serine/threonine-protein kinase
MAAITLTIVEGSLHGQQHRFEAPCTVDIGRAENCDLRLADDWNCMISRRHCRLEVQPPSIRIRDMGSKNGTFVNGVNIGRRRTESPPCNSPAAASGAVELRPGDHIALGALLLRVELDASDASLRRFVVA